MVRNRPIINVGIIDADTVFREKVGLKLSSFDRPRYQLVYNRKILDRNPRLAFNAKELDVMILGLISSEANITLRLEEIKFQFPNAVLIIVSESYDMSFVKMCIEYGALAYLLKGYDYQYLNCVILEVLAGGSFISPLLARKVFLGLQHREKALKSLTRREMDVVQGLLDGLSYKLIADDYNISLDTVREHIKKIYKKLKINSKGELLAKLNFL
ncbi:LuxR C-terminal-related transcriptional regulator [Sphingobacterium sp. HJSM2_6]|uniref:LuxR C-terminal-related transcriptional regulator n=1 Tax=Sphingobacterium sp. HJSM2_6 TaxID=3366264 RepID=UPI003BD3DEBC